MAKAIKSMIYLLILVSAVSCVSVTAVKPGGDIKADASYVSLVFTDKAELLSIGKRNVYAVVQEKDSRRQFYIPFGIGNEIRLISVTPGNYSLSDFVYLNGIGVSSIDTFRNPPLLLSKPQFANTTLDRADYPEDFRKDFSIEPGEIVFLGNFSSEIKVGLMGAAIKINRTSSTALVARYAISDVYLSMPSSMKVTLPE